MVPRIMSTPSIAAATHRGVRRPSARSVSPEEYRSRTAPLTRPPMATHAKGTRNHVGRIVVSAPMGSPPTAPESLLSEAASSTPYTISTTTGRLPPNVGQPPTPAVEALRGRYLE